MSTCPIEIIANVEGLYATLYGRFPVSGELRPAGRFPDDFPHRRSIPCKLCESPHLRWIAGHDESVAIVGERAGNLADAC